MNTAQPRPNRRDRKWLRRLTVSAVTVGGLCAAALLVSREYYRSVGQRELAAVTAELDTADPGWQLDAVVAEHQSGIPPADRNSGDVVRRIAGQLPNDVITPASLWAKGRDPNRLPSSEEQELAARVDAALAPLTTGWERLIDMTRGGTPLEMPAVKVFVRPVTAVQARRVAAVLACRAEVAAVEGNAGLALRFATAALNSGRSIGDEPTEFSQYQRIHAGRVVAFTAVQTLAWATPSETDLARVQREFTAEADEPFVRRIVRGERALASHALADDTYDALREARAKLLGPNSDSFGHGLGYWWHRRVAVGDHAASVRTATDGLKLDTLPPPERFAAARSLDAERRALRSTVIGNFRFGGTTFLVPNFVSLFDHDAEFKARLRSAATLMACERFRRIHNRWPTALPEIPVDILPVQPTDPYDGQPLRYRPLADGVCVYAVGRDGDDNGGSLSAEQSEPVGADIGFRSWNPNRRRLRETPPAD